MADITERIVIPEVPRVLDGQELYVYIPERKVNSYTKEETDALLATKFDKSNVAQTTGDSADKVMSQKAAMDSFAHLVNGKVPESQLPSYVDDVVEYDSKDDFPATGEEGKIYVDKSTNLTYRWSGSTYIMIGGGDLALENGTGDVLIQTTDANHSFKVMTDGRAKVYGAPQDETDVVRKVELDTKLNSSEKSNFVDLTSAQIITGSKTFTAGIIMQNGFLALGSAAILGAGIRGGGGTPLINVPTSQSGTTSMALSPNTAPTANSIIVNSSTRTPTWKPLSDFFDITVTQRVTPEQYFEKIFVTNIHINTVWSGSNDNSFKFKNPNTYGVAYGIALTPDNAPTEPSFIVNAADRTPTWQSAAPILQDYVDDALLGG